MSKFLTRTSVNIDISNLCALECVRCARQIHYRDKGLKVPGENISTENFKKVLEHFDSISFCGQLSDPVHHPEFVDFLKMCYNRRKEAIIHNASSTKPIEWYEQAFRNNPKAKWWFGIDGLPQDSALYRVHQDGEKLFEVMKLAKKILHILPKWQYIVFSYNENDVDAAIRIAKSIGVELILVISSRWNNSRDPLIPKTDKYRYSPK